MKWRKPAAGWLKCNSDGSFNQQGRGSSCGGLIRDDLSNFVKGFYYKLNPNNALMAEFDGLLYGIRLARSMNVSKIIFEVDFTVLYDMVHKGFTSSYHFKPLLAEALSLFRSSNWQVAMSVANRIANSGADMLANRGHLASFDIYTFDHSFPLLDLLLVKDLGGVCTHTLVSLYNPLVIQKKKIQAFGLRTSCYPYLIVFFFHVSVFSFYFILHIATEKKKLINKLAIQ